MRALLVAAAALLIAACGVQPPVPEDHYYRLAPAGPAESAGEPLWPGVLVVERPVAEGVYGERAILYSDDPRRRVLKQYHYNFWLKSPPQLVQDFLVRALRQGAVAQQVVDEGADLRRGYRLRSRLIRFERLVDPGGVAVEVEFMLTPPGAFEPVFIRRYSETRPVDEEELTAAVAGFEAALGTIAGQLRRDLAAAQQQPSGSVR